MEEFEDDTLDADVPRDGLGGRDHALEELERLRGELGSTLGTHKPEAWSRRKQPCWRPSPMEVLSLHIWRPDRLKS